MIDPTDDMSSNFNDKESNVTEDPKPSRRSARLAIGVVVAGAVLAVTSGVAHAGYRWGKTAPASTTTTTIRPTPTTVKPTPTTVKITPTTEVIDPPVSVGGYRWG